MYSLDHRSLPTDLSLLAIHAEKQALKKEFLKLENADSPRASEIAFRLGKLAEMEDHLKRRNKMPEVQRF
jgi:hypothetical protein